jgi:hypothetical protein
MKVLASAAALSILCGPALANDCVVRVAYPDRDRAPYYMGNGPAIPSSPGAGAELLRQAVRATGCTPELVRLPPARIKLALSNGSIDFALVDLRDNETPYSALPQTATGQPDVRRGMRLTAVVYVRAVDGLPATTNPRDYFRNRILASNQASSLGDQLRSDGYKVDDGAADANSNMEKLMFRRVDGFTIAVSNPDAVDPVVAARYGANLVRLPQPLRTSTAWLSASNAYHQQHGERVEAVWSWWSENSVRRLGELVRQYTVAKPAP